MSGNVVATGQNGGGVSTYLPNAREIIVDGLGDDDGLCETGESCIYAPHFGAYQGRGTFWRRRCRFAEGVVRGVVMYAYLQD